MLESIPFPSPQLKTISNALTSEADVIIVSLTEDGTKPPSLAAIDEHCDGLVGRMIDADQFRGKRGESSQFAASIDGRTLLVLVLGLGSDAPNRELAFESAASAVRKLADREREHIVVALGESFPEEMHDSIVAGAITACESQSIYQTDPSLFVPNRISFAGLSEQSLTRGTAIGNAVNLTRRLVNEPPSVLYPESFVEMCRPVAEAAGISLESWDEQKLDSEGCRAILAVGAGSSRPPRLMMMRYSGGGDEPPIALVGKGVTFDSGGYSLKPSESMKDMKCDMAGAATVVGVMQAVATLGVKQNVLGVCGLAENMVSGSSYKLGDVIETRSGKTIEILNTDAEGRVVLADTLDVAIQHGPRAMVDLATLTGACLVALGREVAGLMTNHQATCDEIESAAKSEGEPVWQLPMFELFNDKVKSQVADIKNVGDGRWGGAITAAKFLENFVNDVPWVHIDIAGPAFSDKPKASCDAGATGAMVRTLTRWIENQ